MVPAMPAPGLIIDTFAGPGGWDEGLALLGHRNVVGIEWDASACATRAAAGHATIQADVAAFPTRHLSGRVDGFLSSPPCQGFSQGGKQDGVADLDAVIVAVRRVAAGDDSAITELAAQSSDPRSSLVLEPVRWVRDLQPRWVALEQVKLVLPVWEAFRRTLSTWGYSVWTGILNSADYGVPQARRRAILVARRDGQVAAPPDPSHAARPEPTLFGSAPQPWVTLADALGWTVEEADQRAAAALGVTDPGPWVWDIPMDPDTRGPSLPPSEWPATPNRWVFDRPATTVVSSFRPDVVSAPGYRRTGDGPRQNQPGGVHVTADEAGILQSFPAGYPWSGNDAKQREQIGNAVPPRLAAAVCAQFVNPAAGSRPAGPPVELAEVS